MNNTAIKVENLSKQYRLGVIGTGTLSHDLKRWWTINVIGKEDPYLKIGETNDRSSKGKSEYVWALKDINLDIKEGEVVGIIGKNGAGKSTLLKILSKVTKPTTGIIKYRGRIASLLEVGTGFHPEMTGKENIYMNGSIMGMSRAEISRKMNEIVDFAGVERYINTPVKRYSSGMTVRLGFSIAAHLEPDILVVDEVLAVGDAEFQKKAIGKMKDVSKGGGRTVLFVSHNMTAIKSLCERVVLLRNGMIQIDENPSKCIDLYLKEGSDSVNENFKKLNDKYLNELVIVQAGVKNMNNDFNEEISLDKIIVFEMEILKLEPSNQYDVTFQIINDKGEILMVLSSAESSDYLNKGIDGRFVFSCELPAFFFNTGIFHLTILINKNRNERIKMYNSILTVNILPATISIGGWMNSGAGYFRPRLNWRIFKDEK